MTSAIKASVLVRIGADLGSSFRGSFTSANKQISSLGSAIKSFDNRLSNIQSLKQTRSDTLKAYQAWRVAQGGVRRLATEISKADNPTKKLQNSFRKAKNSARLAKM